MTDLRAGAPAVAPNGVPAARQATGETVAQTRGLMRNNPHPAAEAFSKASNGAAEFGRGNLEAVAQSAQAYPTGMQELGRRYAAAVQGLTRHRSEERRGGKECRSWWAA